MKKTYILSIILLICNIVMHAQNDTMYIMKAGVVIKKQSIKPNDVDSIIFYKPTIVNKTTVTDIDGNIYNTVTIGTQVWMSENLKTTKYNDGTSIPLVTTDNTWSSLSTPGYCWYSNNQTQYSNPYGALYNWYTVNTGNLCPSGWHVPSDAEWTLLTEYLGGLDVAGSKLKEFGTRHWYSNNLDATNETGYTAVPGGQRLTSGTFFDIGSLGYWWCATESNDYYAFYRIMLYHYSTVRRGYIDKRVGYSVRCVRD